MQELKDVNDWIERLDLESVNPGWFALAFAMLAILDSMSAIRTGRIKASFRNRWRWLEVITIERDKNPIQFWIRAMIPMVIGYALVVFGVRSLTSG